MRLIIKYSLQIMQYGHTICQIDGLNFVSAKRLYYRMASDIHQYTCLLIDGVPCTTAEAERHLGPQSYELPILSRKGEKCRERYLQSIAE